MVARFSFPQRRFKILRYPTVEGMVPTVSEPPHSIILFMSTAEEVVLLHKENEENKAKLDAVDTNNAEK